MMDALPVAMAEGHTREESGMINNRFTVCTWNVYHGSTVKQLEPLLVNERHEDTALLALQEANVPGIAVLLHQHGMDSVSRDQFRTAWDPEWLTLAHAELVDLSESTWLQSGGGRTNSIALRTILCDRHGRSIEFINYHLPAHVQPEGTEGREAASRESAETLGEMARDSVATGFLACGDDNVYEQGAGDFRYLMEAATGLRQIQAKNGTFGHRPIDDFRFPRDGRLRYVKGSSETGTGTPAERPSHDRHRITLRWTDQVT